MSFIIIFFSMGTIITFFLLRDWYLTDKYGYKCWNCEKRKKENFDGIGIFECKECHTRRKISERFCPVCKEKTILHWDICQKCGVRSEKI